ncbi:MAG: ADP-glyceromanno-heptose 6-epimerase [Candidatus Methylopumilus sp.]|nr:ADP-glyceromanno-heptose 6-epimerase [Candidatus Methylopumilus sp.]
MIILTGGAGMIGSVIAWHLNSILDRKDIIVVDDIHHQDQWNNLSKRTYIDYLDKDDLFPWLEKKQEIEVIIHMGAISATTETDFNKLLNQNIRYSQNLWRYASDHNVPFLYASSAATYGGGEFGYDDNEAVLRKLRPLNAYGYSKQFFDQWAVQQVLAKEKTPPQWCGFKFFNVYGPNEYHKDRMASVVFHAFNQLKTEGEIRLFKSDRPDYKDGMQLRDFVYVKDAAAVVLHFLSHKKHSGIYNVGTGKASSFKALAESLVKSVKGDLNTIKYIDMPNDLKGKYQYFTEANIKKLKDAGYTKPFLSIEEGVEDYAINYLTKSDTYA